MRVGGGSHVPPSLLCLFPVERSRMGLQRTWERPCGCWSSEVPAGTWPGEHQQQARSGLWGSWLNCSTGKWKHLCGKCFEAELVKDGESNYQVWGGSQLCPGCRFSPSGVSRNQSAGTGRPGSPSPAREGCPQKQRFSGCDPKSLHSCNVFALERRQTSF